VKRILIVEDEQNIRLLVRLVLQNHYELREAGDGLEALAILADWRPDLALVDVSMPNLDGIELCRRIKSDPTTQDVRVILVTGLTQNRDRLRGEEAGADGYLKKPFSPSVLTEQIAALLG
jgi:CheY-like chemotaxis protein